VSHSTDLARLIAGLARLDPATRRDSVRAARARRQWQIREAVCDVRFALLADCSNRQAARVMDDAVRGRRTESAPVAVRVAVRAALTEALGFVTDFPAFERICQLIEE
jgi:hypothetical protein